MLYIDRMVDCIIIIACMCILQPFGQASPPDGKMTSGGEEQRAVMKVAGAAQRKDRRAKRFSP